MQLSRTRLASFYLILFLLIWVFAELAGLVYFRAIHQSWFSWSELAEQRSQVTDEYIREQQQEQRRATSISTTNTVRDPNVVLKAREEVLHPFLGYVLRYSRLPCGGIGFCDRRILEQQLNPFKREAGKLYVGVFGGSFAQGVSLLSTPGKLEQALKTIPEYANQEIVVFTLAHGGYKQPQQLLGLNYFLVQGMPLDLIINIDGYNELVLSVVEGVVMQSHPLFPRSWPRRLRGSYNKDLLLMLARTEQLKKKRFEQARDLNDSLLRFSVLANNYWLGRDQKMAIRIAESQEQFVNYRSAGRVRSSFSARGPEYPREVTRQTLDDIVGFWGNSSSLMRGIADSIGARYFHFLQPNQYVEGSKPMSEAERAVAIKEQKLNWKFSLDNYLMLADAGQQLKQQGVNFHDLTGVYKNHPQPLYRDICCHVNQEGYDIIIDAVVDHIRSQ